MSKQVPIQAVTTDGRTLSGTASGPIDGRPVLFIAGAATGKSMGFAGDLLEYSNVRLLTMDRAGMGESTPDANRTVASTADDYRCFVARVLERSDFAIPVVANSQGGVFGLSAATATWVSRLILVSPADEIAHPEIHAMLPPEATQLSDLVRENPRAAENLLAEFTAARMEEMVRGGAGELDRAFYAKPDFLELYRRALAEGFANNGVGYVRDSLIAMGPWTVLLEEIISPVTILFGAGDLGHSPDHGETLARRIPNAHREVIPDAGGALLWTHPGDIMTFVLGGSSRPQR